MIPAWEGCALGLTCVTFPCFGVDCNTRRVLAISTVKRRSGAALPWPSRPGVVAPLRASDRSKAAFALQSRFCALGPARSDIDHRQRLDK